MARYKLILAYDGTQFAGSQRQARRRTVQSELERAAAKLGWTGSAAVLAGRTDAGVHAIGQVATLDLQWKHGPEGLRDALNAQLPADVAVTHAETAADGFHPRFDALHRRYRYVIRCARIRQPLADRMAWRVWPPVDLNALRSAAALLRGTHDFGAFGSAPRKGADTRRTILQVAWSADGDELRFEVTANAFLYRMVRRLVFVQVAVGQGRCTHTLVRQALAAGKRVPGLPAGTAPPQGLRLMEVAY